MVGKKTDGGAACTRVWQRRVARAAASVVLSLASAARAQNTLSIVPTGVSPAGGAVIAVAANSAQKLTGLVADLQFDPALCAGVSAQHLDTTERVTLGTERVVLDQDEAFACAPTGRRALVLIDLAPRAETGEAVIPAGSGEIARWSLTLNGAAAAASYPITITVKAARNGPEEVPLQTMDGFLTCAGNCDGNEQVTVNEIITGVNIANGTHGADECTPMDTDRNGEVIINELIAAVGNLLNGCKVSQ